MTLPLKGILALAGGVAYHMIMGCMYIYGGISIYLASYYRQYDPSVSTRFLITFLPLRGIMVIFFLPYGAYLTKTYGTRFTTMLGGGAIMICMLCLIFVTNKYLFLFFFSGTFGLSTINFMAPVMCAWKHFPTNRGTVSGIVIAGFALGPFIFNFLTKILANPNGLSTTISVQSGDIVDHYYGPEVANNVPKMFFVLFIIWSSMVIFTYIFMVEPTNISEALYKSIDTYAEDENFDDSYVMSSIIVINNK